LTSGLVLKKLISAKNENLQAQEVQADPKDSAAERVINFPGQFNGLASSIIIDNQDGANAVTVRLNRSINSITIPASSFRTFNDSYIEQINLTGASTNVQVAAQVVSLEDLGLT